MIQFRNYQTEIIEKSVDILSKHRFLYLSMEVRTGKTLTSLGCLNKMMSVNNVLFITKKKAISSIESDYICNPSYNIFVINYESCTRSSNEVGMLLCVMRRIAWVLFQNQQESNKSSPYSNKQRVILLSGTPTESFSQMYRQVFIPNNPFKQLRFL